MAGQEEAFRTCTDGFVTYDDTACVVVREAYGVAVMDRVVAFARARGWEPSCILGAGEPGIYFYYFNRA